MMWGGAPSPAAIAAAAAAAGASGPNVIVDALLRAESGAVERVDFTVPAESLSVNPVGYLQFEWLLASGSSVTEDSLAPIEALAMPRTDRGLGIETTALFRADAGIPAESLFGVLARFRPWIEWVLLVDPPHVPIEWGASLAADPPAPAESLRGAAGDIRSPVEFGGALAVLADALLRLELVAAARSDIEAPSETLGTPTAAVAGDSGLPVETSGLLRADSAALAETLGNLRRDHPAFTELLAAARRDDAFAVEFLGLAASALGLPAEMQGQAVVAMEALAAIEMGALAYIAAGPLGLEALFSLGKDIPAPAEALRGVAGDGYTPAEIAAGAGTRHLADLETTGRLATDTTALGEAGAGLGGSFSAPAEVLAMALSRHPVPIEAAAILAGNSAALAEALAQLARDDAALAEWQHLIARYFIDMGLPAEAQQLGGIPLVSLSRLLRSPGKRRVLRALPYRS